MARQIVLSNGELHVGINNFGLVHDFYYPHVGLENHAAGKDLRHKVGVWVDGTISWLDDGSWDFRFRSSAAALVGHTRAKHDRLGIIIEFDDFVDAEESIFLRNIHVINTRNEAREIKLFLHQAFVIGDGRSNTDTAQYLPDSNSIVHYRGRRVFIIGGRDEDDATFDQRSIGLFGIEGHEGTWRDADDGELSNGSVEHGRVDSTLRFSLHIDAQASKRVYYWIAAGRTMRDALSLHKKMHVDSESLVERQKQTVMWWNKWLSPARQFAERLPKERQELFMKSAMVVKAHIDRDGAIIASTDTAMLNYSRDAYGYCWPRDGAYALWPLIRLGYTSEAMKFFNFMQSVIHPHGYLMHKYRADGALGSSWHPYVHGSMTAPPIQEDETALVLFMYVQFYDANPSLAEIERLYEPFVQKMANFLAEYVDEKTGLPKPSYDLWEEKFQTSTYTVAVVYAALQGAADIAETQNDQLHAVKWRSAADDIAQAARRYLYDTETRRLRKGVIFDTDAISYDNTLDASSLYASFMYGLFGNELSLMLDMHEAYNAIKPNQYTPGVQRYEHDSYRRKADVAPSNSWIISSLWHAQYLLEKNKSEEANAIIDWVDSVATSTGMLAEQIDPDTNLPISVAPLVWSHSEYMSTMLDALSGDK